MIWIFNKIAELLHRSFSVSVPFKKHFVSDLMDSIKAQRDWYDRRNRDIQERAIQLRLDSLQENYLCCVCFAPGEERDSVAQLDNSYIMVDLLPQESIEAALFKSTEVLETKDPVFAGKDDPLGDSLKRLPYNLRRGSSMMMDSLNSIQQTDPLYKLDRINGTSSKLCDENSITTINGKQVSSREQGSLRFDEVPRRRAEHHPSEETHATLVLQRKLIPQISAALDPAHVPQTEVKNMIDRIHNVFIKKKIHSKLHTVASIRDKGLIIIEDSDIELFSCFFRHPVRGYLCERCYTSVLKSLDALSCHIQTILFKAKHPLLRKAPYKEFEQLHSMKPPPLVSGKFPLGPLHQPIEGEYSWKAGSPNAASPCSQKGGSVIVKTRTQPSGDLSKIPGSLVRLSLTGKVSTPDSTVLDDDIILSLRATVKCGICLRRPCSFFVQVNALFICEFCCAWDRFYRDHAICINDEDMPLKCACLLTELSSYYKQIYFQKELREIPQTELQIAPRSLFLPEENIFSTQNLPASHDISQNDTEISGLNIMDEVMTLPVLEERPFYKKEIPTDPRDLRALVSSTRVSLFADTCIKQKGEPDLFEIVITESQKPLIQIDTPGQLLQTDDTTILDSEGQKNLSFFFL
ncbi:unnamed protein product, partial [Phytomonas sp. Hart1]